jgi:hypothetical protein
MPRNRRNDVDIRDYVDYFSFPYFYDWLDWKPDQSASVVGSIGSGKSNLLTALLPKLPQTVVFGTKPTDPFYNTLQSKGFARLTSWPRPTILDKHPNPGPKILLQPDLTNLQGDVARQTKVFGDAMARIFTDASEPGHGRAVVVDETRYLIQTLGLAKPFLTLLLQGRALKVPVISGSQRTSWVPREVWSEAIHIFIFGTRDRRDLMSLRELGGKADPEIVSAAVLSLEQFEFLYVQRISGRMAICKAPQAY